MTALLARKLAAFWHGQALGPDLGASRVRFVPSSTEIAQAALHKAVRLGQEVGWQWDVHPRRYWDWSRARQAARACSCSQPSSGRLQGSTKIQEEPCQDMLECGLALYTSKGKDAQEEMRNRAALALCRGCEGLFMRPGAAAPCLCTCTRLTVRISAAKHQIWRLSSSEMYPVPGAVSGSTVPGVGT